MANPTGVTDDPKLNERLGLGLPIGADSQVLYAGTGVPSNALGQNGCFYFRQDGGAGTCLYQKRAGAWVATSA